MKLLTYTIGGQKIGIDIKSWSNATLSGNTAFITIADTGSTPSNYTNISSVNNWSQFGNAAGLTSAQVKDEIVKLIPSTPTQAQYDILAKYMDAGINSMTKIGTSVSLGNIITGTTYLTGIKDIKLNITGSTSTGNTIINGNLVGKVLSGSTCMYSPIMYGITCMYSPIVYGSTCVYSPIVYGSTCVYSPRICGTSCIVTPIIQLSTGAAAGCVLVSNAAGCGVWTTPSSYINWSGSTANGVGTYVSATCIKSNPNMTFNGSALSITGNINASTYVCSPIITGSTRVCSPIVCGTSCITSPITCGTTCVQTALLCSTGNVKGTIVTGSTCVTSPTIYAGTCLCSIGTTRLVGGATAASFLNVSGNTKLSAVKACQVVFGNNTSCALTGNTCMVYNTTTCTLCTNYLQLTSPNAYLYATRSGAVTNGNTTCCKYLGLTGTSMCAGTYAVDFTGTFGTSGSNGETLVKFTCNNTIVGGKETYFRMSISSAEQTASTFANLSLGAGTNCFDIWFRSCAQTACADYAAIRVRRIC